MELLFAGLPVAGWSPMIWRDRRSAASQKRPRPGPDFAGYGAKGSTAGSEGRP